MAEKQTLFTSRAYKQGELFKTWKLRNIVLEDVQGQLLLSYFRTNGELKGSMVILRATDSIGVFGSRMSNVYHNRKQCVIIFAKSHGKDRRLLLHCESDAKTKELHDLILNFTSKKVEVPRVEKKTILYVTASPMGNHSNSIQVANAFMEEYAKSFPNHEIRRVDLSARNLPPFTAKRVQAKFAMWAGKEEPEGTHEEWAFTLSLIDEFLHADKYVFAVPMWNFGVANQMKLYLDHIVQPWKTFDPTRTPGGMVIGKPALLVTASGYPILGTPSDFTSSYMKSILSFIGFSDIRSILISGTSNPETAPSILGSAIEEAKLIAPKFEFDANNNVELLSIAENQLSEAENVLPIGKRVLAIVSSPMGQFSASTTILNTFLDEYKRKVPDAVINTFDVFQRKLLPFTAERVQAKFATFVGNPVPENLERSWEFTQELIREFQWADTYVFAVPMWNLAIPNQLKLYLDHIVQPWKTFDPSKSPGGLVTGKPCFLICASGSGLLGSPYDYVTPYLKTVLGFIGFTDIRKVWINGTAMDAKEALVKGANDAKLLIKNAKTEEEVKLELKNNNIVVEEKVNKSNVLVITASPMGKFSNSIKVTNAFIDEYKRCNPDHKITIIDLSERNLPPFTAKRVQAKFATWGGAEEPEGSVEEWGITKDLIDEFLHADKYVFAVPMWNFGVANQMKLYLDHIVQPWKTFDPTKMPGGMVIGKPALLVAASGYPILGTPSDFTSSYMKSILSFIGFSDIRSILISGTSNPETAPSILGSAIEEAKLIAPKFEFDANNKVEIADFSAEQSPSAENTLPIGKRVLAIVSSPMGQFSASTTILNTFLDEYKRKVPDAVINTFDVFQRKLLPFTAERVQAKFATFVGNPVPENLEQSWEFTKELIEEFKWADTYVFAVPMWNLAIPNQLKLYLDHIVQPWKTFDPSKSPGGLVTGKPCFLICASGGGLLGSPYDYVTPYLKTVLGFIGFTDIRKVWINGTSSSDKLKGLLEEKSQEVVQLLEKSYCSFVPVSSLEKVLKIYEEALIIHDVERLSSLYAEDARLIINNFGSADYVGVDQISAAYASFLPQYKRISFHLDIVDIVEYSEVAHAITTIRSNHNEFAFREMFVLGKVQSEWKIICHTTNISFEKSS